MTISGVQEEALSVSLYTRLLGGSTGDNKVLLEAVVSCMTGQFEPRPSVFSEAVLGCPVNLTDFVLTQKGQGLGRRPGGIGSGLLVSRRTLTVFPPGESSVESESESEGAKETQAFLQGVKESQEEPAAAVMKESPKEGVVAEVKEVAKEEVAKEAVKEVVVKEVAKEVVKEVVVKKPRKNRTKTEPKRGVSKALQRAALNKKLLEVQAAKEAAAKKAAAKEAKTNEAAAAQEAKRKALEMEINAEESGVTDTDEESQEEVMEIVPEEGEIS